jgi:hypothetical protein
MLAESKIDLRRLNGSVQLLRDRNAQFSATLETIENQLAIDSEELSPPAPPPHPRPSPPKRAPLVCGSYYSDWPEWTDEDPTTDRCSAICRGKAEFCERQTITELMKHGSGIDGPIEGPPFPSRYPEQWASYSVAAAQLLSHAAWIRGPGQPNKSADFWFAHRGDCKKSDYPSWGPSVVSVDIDAERGLGAVAPDVREARCSQVHLFLCCDSEIRKRLYEAEGR